ACRRQRNFHAPFLEVHSLGPQCSTPAGVNETFTSGRAATLPSSTAGAQRLPASTKLSRSPSASSAWGFQSAQRLPASTKLSPPTPIACHVKRQVLNACRRQRNFHMRVRSQIHATKHVLNACR